MYERRLYNVKDIGLRDMQMIIKQILANGWKCKRYDKGIGIYVMITTKINLAVIVCVDAFMSLFVFQQSIGKIVHTQYTIYWWENKNSDRCTHQNCGCILTEMFWKSTFYWNGLVESTIVFFCLFYVLRIHVRTYVCTKPTK